MKRRVLIVDDQPRLLESLNRSLRHRHEEWALEYFSDGFAAAHALGDHNFDVIICDTRMMGHGGERLLHQCQEMQPDAVRIAMTSSSEDKLLNGEAHRKICKPFQGRDIEELIERSCMLKSMLDDNAISELVGDVDQLPALPRTYMELTAALQDPGVEIDHIARIVSQDMALCAKLLKVANSAFFGLRRQITSVRHAIVYLGMRMIRELVFSIEVFSSFPGGMAKTRMTPESLQNHALLTARIATHLCELNYTHLKEHVFMAAMLHDLGKMVLACHAPSHLLPLVQASEHEGRSLYEIEREQGVTTHAEVGAHLIGFWGLPYSIVESVAFHHDPWCLGQTSVDLPTIVYLASHFANNVGDDALNLTFLQELGVSHAQLSSWRTMARGHIESFESETWT